MPLNSFKITNEQGLVHASCDQVPELMLIAGGNGVGKSTLLAALSRWKRNEQIDESNAYPLYFRPFRGVVPRPLLQQDSAPTHPTQSMKAAVSGKVGGWVGLRLPEQKTSDPKNDVDLAVGSSIKFGLVQLELARRNRIAQVVTATNSASHEFPDVFQPLNEALNALLPYLVLDKVELSEDAINPHGCWFRHMWAERESVNLDWLSTGEMAVLSILGPLVESQMWTIVDQIARPSRSPSGTHINEDVDLVVLIDEIEQHLHPELQIRLLNYLRHRSRTHREQFILTTQSAVLIDDALAGELFVLRKPAAAKENQLLRVEAEPERLSAIKSITGGIAPLTSQRPLLLLEGRVKVNKYVSDLELVETLSPELASRFVLIPTGGSSNVLDQLQRLRDLLRAERFGVHCYALVDGDRRQELPAGAVSWDVCTIENLLILSEDAVGRMLTRFLMGPPPHPGKLLQKAALEIRDDEISIRAHEALRIRTFQPKGESVKEVEAEFYKHASVVQTRQVQVEKVFDRSSTEVDRYLSDGTFVRRFRGKKLLETLYRLLEFQDHQISKRDFALALAEEAATEPAIQRKLDDVSEALDRLRLLDKPASPPN